MTRGAASGGEPSADGLVRHDVKRSLPSDADASGRDLGQAELDLLASVVRQGTLNSTRGTLVKRFEREFAARLGIGHAIACASGTAAIHAAVAALGLEAGDEVITTSITDMGALTPLLYEGLVPVFCDVDSDAGVVTAATISARLTPRTRAVIVTHLFGMPCDLGPIMALAASRRLMVIEDCAQALLAEDTVGLVGTVGHAACFSFQQGKHLTTGEGGMVVTAEPALAARIRKFVNKGWGYDDPDPDHDFPALNYRMTELQGAVGVAQLAKVDAALVRRRASAQQLCAAACELPGIRAPRARPGTTHSFWRLALLVDPEVVEGGADGMAKDLAASGVAAQPHYIKRPAYATRVFRAWREHALTRIVFERAGHGPEPAPGSMPGTERLLQRVLVLPWNERYTSADAAAVRAALAHAHANRWRAGASR